jgi:hypothetical protein
VAITKLILEIYKDFGFDDVRIKFSDRPAKRVGDDAVWDKAESALKAAADAAGIEYSLNPGEGAFYGPKLEFVLRDAIGRDWQCGTLQVDLNMPGRLGVGHDLPPGVGWDWRNWSAARGYLFSDSSLDLSGYAAFQGELLALHFTDDTGFAPPATVTDLLRHFSNARIERLEYNPRAQSHGPVGHFGFFSRKNADLWPLVSRWLDPSGAAVAARQ